MTQFRRGAGRWLLALGVTMLAGIEQATAGAEARDFTILVDNKPAGSYQMTIQPQDKDTLVVTCRADVAVRYLVYRYTYSYYGRETWKGDRLQAFQSSANDNGTRFQVSAAPDGDYLRVRVNGKDHLTRADAWLTTYWRLPPARYRNQAVPLVDSDTGKDINGRLQFIATEKVQVAGQMQNCSHYRLTGGPYPIDLWYDGQERLVRQTFVERGHQTLIHLAGIRR